MSLILWAVGILFAIYVVLTLIGAFLIVVADIYDEVSRKWHSLIDHRK